MYNLLQENALVILTCNMVFDHFHTDVNECDSRPCQNGGSCYEGSGDYKCVCSGNWTGENCEIGERYI